MANNPSLTEIRSEILHYATLEQEIKELKPIIVVGSLELHTGNCNNVTDRSLMQAQGGPLSWTGGGGGVLRSNVNAKERQPHGGTSKEESGAMAGLRSLLIAFSKDGGGLTAQVAARLSDS